MELFREYQPQAVIRAENEPLKVYSGEELRQVCRTDRPVPILFYDIFLSPDGKELIALQAGEFSYLFLGLRICYNSNPLGVIKKEICHLDNDERAPVVLWKMSLPQPCTDGIKVSIEDGQGLSLEVNIDPYLFASHPVAHITQQTMQQDYPIVWIRDHILYMHRLHGIDRYVVYDNGSSDYSGLIESLRDISESEGLEILVINWPFPYSRAWRLRQEKLGYDTCVQRAAFNHGLLMFESITEYAMNLDIDEYLYNHSFLSLYACIKLGTFLGPVAFASEVIIPNYPDEKKVSIRRANSYYYRQKGCAFETKYAYKADTKLVAQLDIHSAYNMRGINFRVWEAEWKASNKQNRWLVYYLNKIGKVLLRMTVPFFRENALGYYHFKGINTGWSRFLKHNVAKPPEEEESMIEMSAKSRDFVRSANFDAEWRPFDEIKTAFKKIGLD